MSGGDRPVNGEDRPVKRGDRQVKGGDRPVRGGGGVGRSLPASGWAGPAAGAETSVGAERADSPRTSDLPLGTSDLIPRILLRIRREVGAENVDRLWVFEPLRRGRRESGLVVISALRGESEHRTILTIAYHGSRTAPGSRLVHELNHLGRAAPGRLDRIVGAVERRTARLGLADGVGEVVLEGAVNGSPDRFAELVAECSVHLDRPLESR